MYPSQDPTIAREKRAVSLTSLLASLFLTLLKLIVGFATGSLGVLSEAAHSGLDFLATLVTYLAVRVSDRPADRDHLYGHGKIENLAALVESALLAVTCLWIIAEAVRRLFFHAVLVYPASVAFATMVISIAVDLSRSRALSRTARRAQSQALEADALHFSTDIWSSAVVLLGLGLVWAAEQFEMPRLRVADPVAALGVAGIALALSWRLAKRAADVLLDRAPETLVRGVTAAVRGVEGIRDPVTVRARQAGPQVFVDAAVSIERGTSFETTHRLTEEVEAAVQRLAPGADVVVHAEPLPADDESLGERIRLLVARHGLAAHNVALTRLGDETRADLHLEVDEGLTLGEAHRLADGIEAAVRNEIPEVHGVTIHLETLARGVRGGEEVLSLPEGFRQRLAALAREIPEILDLHGVTLTRVDGRLRLTCHCTLEASTAIGRAHEVATALERRILRDQPEIQAVTIHAEPPGADVP